MPRLQFPRSATFECPVSTIKWQGFCSAFFWLIRFPQSTRPKHKGIFRLEQKLQLQSEMPFGEKYEATGIISWRYSCKKYIEKWKSIPVALACFINHSFGGAQYESKNPESDKNLSKIMLKTPKIRDAYYRVLHHAASCIRLWVMDIILYPGKRDESFTLSWIMKTLQM